MIVGLLIATVVVLLLLAASVRIVPEYERGVIFRLGRVIDAKGPGLFFLIPIVDRMRRVSLRTVTMDIPPQDVITKDNVTVRVNAVTYFNVADPVRSVIAIENHFVGTSQISQTTLRSVLGQVDLDELLIKREDINARLQQIIDEVTNPWGVKVIHAHGEFEAAETLGNAAEILEAHPAAMQLRVLSTMAEVSAERNSTLIFPLPMEILRLVDTLRATGQPTR